eukprot:Seg1738.6 transcript_id=Seg1738.6/GoldUCD/mRNA.D3Y31 product="Haloacid dehalogenase-like hydrolase domain-containing protein 3" protein_id=Seg1738.6/GoldUCD/D3Y31
MPLRLITFDVTNTLLKIRGSVGEHYAAIANKYYGATQLSFDNEQTEVAFGRAYKEVNRLMPNFGYNNLISSEAWWYEVVHRVFFNLGLRDIRTLKSISNQLYTDYCSKDKYELFPEVKDVLHELKCDTDIKLGIISNFDERLEFLLEQLEIREFFDYILCSRAIGIAKPDNRIFTAALALCGNVKPFEALHIGDDFQLDYVSARESGFNALLIDRECQKVNKKLQNFTVQKIDSLECLLPSKLKDSCSIFQERPV